MSQWLAAWTTVQTINTDSSHVHNTAETQITAWDSDSVYWAQHSRFLLSSDQGHRTSFWKVMFLWPKYSRGQCPKHIILNLFIFTITTKHYIFCKKLEIRENTATHSAHQYLKGKKMLVSFDVFMAMMLFFKNYCCMKLIRRSDVAYLRNVQNFNSHWWFQKKQY